MKKIILIATSVVASTLSLFADQWVNTVSANGEKPDTSRYGTALISNGDISTVIDNLGVQKQKVYAKMTPSVARAARRYGMPSETLISHGWFDTNLEIDGKNQSVEKWSQTLDNKRAFVENIVEYSDASVKTVAFVPLTRAMLIVKKVVTPKKSAKVKFDFRYVFAPKANGKPRDRVHTFEAVADKGLARFVYKMYGLDIYRGEISISSSFPTDVKFENGNDIASLSALADASPEKPLEIVYAITYDDDYDGGKYIEQAAAQRKIFAEKGFDGLFAEHVAEWAKYWNDGYFIDIPNKPLETSYYTGLYHQRCNATRWSLPVGIFSGSHWGGSYFGWDETFNQLALVSSGKFDISQRPIDYRKATLNTAMVRTHKGKPQRLKFGARYTWQSYEPHIAKLEKSEPGYWLEHIFHMSNITVEAWNQYLYTNDEKYLKDTIYPIVSECAAYYLAHWLYKDKNGRTIVGKCTDLERMGPAVLNPFMTSCGIIYNLETAARAAKILDCDADFAKKCEVAAAELRKSLPNDGEKFIPYEDSKDTSINVVGGLFPYPVFDENNAMLKNAVYDFFKNIRKAGNMYNVGKGVNAWYAGWTTAAFVPYRDKVLPEKLLEIAANESGAFGDTYEINEPPKVQHHPWFSTASGNIVYATNLILLHNKENGDIFVAPSVPESWKNYSFKLPCYGALDFEAQVRDGKLDKALLVSRKGGDTGTVRTICLPANIVDESKIVGKFVRDGDLVKISAKADEIFYK